MRFTMLLLFLSALTLTGCSIKSTQTSMHSSSQPAPYPDLGAAPELNNETWLNTEAPLRLADLRGKVVLLDMWTFG